MGSNPTGVGDFSLSPCGPISFLGLSLRRYYLAYLNSLLQLTTFKPPYLFKINMPMGMCTVLLLLKAIVLGYFYAKNSKNNEFWRVFEKLILSNLQANRSSAFVVKHVNQVKDLK